MNADLSTPDVNLRQDVAVLWLPCLYWWQRPFAAWLWVWPHECTYQELWR